MAKKKNHKKSIQKPSNSNIVTPVWKMSESELRAHRVKKTLSGSKPSYTEQRAREEKRERKALKRERRRGRSHVLSLRSKIIIGVLILLIIAGVGATLYIRQNYKITTITVSGNNHYTDEEIINMVMTDPLDHYSIFLNWKYHNREVDSIPFVSAVEVSITSTDTVNITIYEKSIAGYVSFMGRYMYFDKDGTVVESSQRLIGDVPEVTGLEFNSVVVAEKLPVADDSVFTKIINITQALEKYDLDSDQIYFDAESKVTLYFDTVRVKIGDAAEIDEKFSELISILPQLTGRTGVLNMQNYTSSSTVVVFQSDFPLEGAEEATEEEIDTTLY